MRGEMKQLSRYEIEKVMEKFSRERARVVKEFCQKAEALNVGEEFFQCHISALPEVPELKDMLRKDEEANGKQFEIYRTINGTIVKRVA